MAHDVKDAVLIADHVDIQVNATLHVSHAFNNVLDGCELTLQTGGTLSLHTA
jgi:hypothetical protein